MSVSRPVPTPETLTRHELVGLSAEVVDATNPDLVGVGGEVVGETTDTLDIERDGRLRQVPKAAATFAVDLPAGRVRVAGERLVGRPAERSERRSDPIWH